MELIKKLKKSKSLLEDVKIELNKKGFSNNSVECQELIEAISLICFLIKSLDKQLATDDSNIL